MTCFHPLKGYRSPGGRVTFSRRDAFIDLPVTVSCGQCTGCRLERSRNWAIRCIHEAQMHEQNSFITLTYDNKNLPRDWSLNVSHWQNFAKKLRREVRPFRFFHCGEYGDEYGRPHYHACLFGINFEEDRTEWTGKKNEKYYESKTLSDTWGKGLSVIGELTFESAAYVARYIMKKQTGQNAEFAYLWVDEKGKMYEQKPEYTTMSRRPGIGKAWYDKYGEETYRDDTVIINGREVRPPKFYDSQYELDEPKRMEEIKGNRIRKAKRQEKDNTPERLHVRKTVTEARIKQLTRNKTEQKTKHRQG